MGHLRLQGFHIGNPSITRNYTEGMGGRISCDLVEIVVHKSRINRQSGFIIYSNILIIM